MINFQLIEENASEFAAAYRSASPFEHVVIDGVLDPVKARAMVSLIPQPSSHQESRDYIFARNKFEHPRFYEYGDLFRELKGDLLSERFRSALCTITGAELFVDAEFVGGGIHQGGAGSFLDMHADFNRHPVREEWSRELNLLIYLNDGWETEHGGHLELRHADTGAHTRVEPLFNRMVIMMTKSHTLHGYHPINFPPGRYRTSIAAYAFSTGNTTEPARSTVWYPESGGWTKKALGRLTPRLITWKTRLFGSGTARKARRKN